MHFSLACGLSSARTSAMPTCSATVAVGATRAACLRLALKAIRAEMTPAVASATVRLALRNIAFICYRDMTRVASWWIHVPGNATTRIEIFIHRQN
jgi:hypothetical protein